VRQRLFPPIGNGARVMSYVHLEDVAAPTVLAPEHGGAGIYNIVDADPDARCTRSGLRSASGRGLTAPWLRSECFTLSPAGGLLLSEDTCCF
jgi:NAD dependent epimerase/dehydratase family enzyme